MKNSILITCLFFTLKIKAQETITKNYFPKINTVSYLATATRATISPIKITSGGGNQIWNFTDLLPQSIDTQRFVSPNTEGVLLCPSANLTLQPNSLIQIPFYRKTDTALDIVGYKGLFLQGFFIPTKVALHTPLRERVAPLKMGDKYVQYAGYIAPFSSRIAPDSVLRSSPFLVPDSVRITYDLTRHDTVDAWGIARMPDSDYLVLRQKRKELINVKIDIKYGELAWVDVTTLVLAGLAEPFNNARFYTYFWSNKATEALAILETDKLDNVVNVQYQFNPVSNFIDKNTNSDAIKLYPNPVSDRLNLDLKGFNLAVSDLILLDAQGKLLVSKSVDTTEITTIDLHYYPTGGYWLFLTDKQGRIIARKTFIKI